MGRILAVVLAATLGSACAAHRTSNPTHPLAPIGEIVLMDGLLNLGGRRLYPDAYDVTPASIWRNLRGPWVVDNDEIPINQIGHPYQGAMYHAIARSTGHNYWPAAVYTFAGSILWEIAGETTPPSLNDQVASGIAGSFLGEALFRSANLAIAKSGNAPGFWRSLLVAGLSPPTTFNRALFGDRFDTVMPTHDPAYDIRLHWGATRAIKDDVPAFVERPRHEGLIDVSIEYGLPASADYPYSRPFDYYRLRAAASTANGIESLTTRGLLAGRSFDAGPGGRGLWGVFGLYDYVAPQIYRISSTAAGVGASAQFLEAGGFTLQGTAIGGLGYAAVQADPVPDDRAYYYGLTPQLELAIRAIAGDRVSFEIEGRGYSISHRFMPDAVGRDVILRAEAEAGVRILPRGAITVRYTFNSRNATFADAAAEAQSRSTIGVFFTVLGPQRFGAVNWRRR
jgi:hypothetical protein